MSPILVPPAAAERSDVEPRARELSAFRSGQVWLSLAATVLGFGGMFGAFTYIAYTLTGVSGFAAGAVPWLLILFGVGLFVGNWVGGRLADRSIDRHAARGCSPRSPWCSPASPSSPACRSVRSSPSC